MIDRTKQPDPLPRLDRLAALLDGCRPRIELPPAPSSSGEEAVCDLRIALMTEGRWQLATAADSRMLLAPAIIVVRRDEALDLEADTDAERSQMIHLCVFLDGPVRSCLLDALPSPLAFCVEKEKDSALHQIIDLIALELASPRCGHSALLQRAGEILFIAILRQLIELPTERAHLFRGLADRRIARAIVAMHARPAFPWSLETLAGEAGMSRTAFANTFRDLLGQTAGRYLTTLRLALARRAIETGRGHKEAARLAGYGSATALSHALARQR